RGLARCRMPDARGDAGGDAGGDDGPGRAAGQDVALAGEQAIGEVDGAPRGDELACQASRRRQPLAGRKRPPRDRLAQARVDLAIEGARRRPVEPEIDPPGNLAPKHGPEAITSGLLWPSRFVVSWSW